MYLALLYATYFYSNKDLKKNDQSNTEQILINRYITNKLFFLVLYIMMHRNLNRYKKLPYY
ncbi:hypothetical protein FDZ59_03760 [Ehrlichia ruminantium]|nr:hypothetical protein FDZ59_03760 [Ehrlichia ruminantium]